MAELSSNYENLEIVKVRRYLDGSLIILTEPSVIANGLLSRFDCSKELMEEYVEKLYDMFNRLIEAHKTINYFLSHINYRYDLSRCVYKLLIYKELRAYPDLRIFTNSMVEYVNICIRVLESCIVDNFKGMSVYDGHFKEGSRIINELNTLVSDFINVSEQVHEENIKNERYIKECN